jgi:hypothetical protein
MENLDSMEGYFLLSKDRRIEGWKITEFAGYTLSTCVDLPLHEISVSSEKWLIVGWIYPIPTTIKDIESAIGRYIIIRESGSIRLDPMGSLSLVYSTKNQEVASIPALLKMELIVDSEIATTVGLPDNDKFYPFGLTQYQDIRRLLPNFALHLCNFSAERIEEYGDCVKHPTKVIAQCLSKNMSMLAENNSLLIALTAGNESRMLLSSVLPNKEMCEFFTFDIKKQDSEAASSLAKMFVLHHRLIKPEFNLEHSIQWYKRTGESVSGSTMRNAFAKSKFQQRKLLLKGMGGEIARAYYYRMEDKHCSLPTARILLERLGINVSQKLLNAADEWIATIKSKDFMKILDMLYLENRVGCWAAPQNYGDYKFFNCIWPLNSRDIISAMMSMPRGQKVNDLMCPEVVKLLNPKLLTIPINGNRWFFYRKFIALFRLNYPIYYLKKFLNENRV